MKTLLVFFLLSIIFSAAYSQQAQRTSDSTNRRRVQDSIRVLTEKDHKEMLAMLGIASLRPGANGSNPNAPNAANYDETKANPYPVLPDALLLKNGRKVIQSRIGGRNAGLNLSKISTEKFMDGSQKKLQKYGGMLLALKMVSSVIFLSSLKNWLAMLIIRSILQSALILISL